MLQTRLIPSLLVDQHLHLVKTRRFRDRHYLGDPLNAAYVFSGYEVDELLVLDIDASRQGRCIPLPFVQALARFTTVPLTVGGGIRTLEQIHDLVAAGVERVVLGDVLDRKGPFLGEAAASFGSSTVTVVINVVRRADGAPEGVFGDPWANHRRALGDALRWCVDCGAGEILLNDVDREGMGEGYDLDLLRSITADIPVPIVALGGCGGPADLARAATEAGVSAAAAGSHFVYAPGTREVLLNYPWDRRSASMGEP